MVNPASTADAPIVPFAITYDVETSSSKVIMTGNVIIDGDLITTGTVNANRINIDGITLSRSGNSLVINAEGVGTAQLAGNAVTIDKIADSIQSSDYVTGVSGWKITKAGASEFSNVTVRGSVDAGSINIDGVTLDTDPITGNLIVKTGGVNTTQVTQNAITSGSTSFTEAATGTTLLQEITINTSTAISSVEIFAQGYIGIVGAGGGGSFVYLNLYRDTTLLKTVTIQAQTDRSVYDTSTIIYLDAPPAVGTYTYKLTRTGYAANVSDRYISVREFKR